MTRAEAQGQFDDFRARLPEILDYFVGVLALEGISAAGTSEEFLSKAGDWIASKGKLVEVRSTAEPRFRDSEMVWDLSVPTMSACCYLGCLIGDCLVKDVPGTRWVLVTENKRDIDYHRAVVRPSFGKGQIEPKRVALNFVLGRLRRSDPRTLGQVYSIWREAFTPKQIPPS